ncbi:MAG TPA: molybdopterin-dependent oxidoreductase [Acetobacteraceae bacterium]
MFPARLTLGSWLGGALAWHLAAMWLVVANFAIYLLYGPASGDRTSRPLPFHGRHCGLHHRASCPGRDGAAWRLEVSGLVTERKPWTVADLAALPQSDQITRHMCIEGWSAIGKWGSVPFRDFLARSGADTRARYVSFRCADGYRSSIDMATALHQQTPLALTFRDGPSPAAYGFPVKLRVPTKLGFKNPKHIVGIEVTNVYPGGFWEDYGYNWFSGS